MASSLISFNAQAIAIAHTVCALSAFLVALAVGCSLHYHKIIQNEHYGYPDEWFPSVSATIGDRYPERSIFQILIALTAGPRFLLLFANYLRLYKPNSKLPIIALVTGIVRTVACGGWVYITSTDDHDFHDFSMISYMVLTIPWDVSITLLTPPRSSLRRHRKYTAIAFFAAIVPLIYLFIQHKVKKVPGAYSYYAYFEWSLIFLDVGFDSWSIKDFKDLYIEIRPSTKEDTYFTANFNVKTIEQKLNDKSTTNEKSSDHLLPKSAGTTSLFRGIVDIINSFIFWSVYTSLYLCIWYFPLWHMGISGYEATALSTFSPVFLLIPGAMNFFTSKPQIARFLCCLLGIGSYLVTEPATRLLIISGGVAFGCIALTVEIAAHGRLNNPEATKTYAASFTLGLAMSAVAKFAFWTENPIWPTMNSDTGGWNKTGLAIGLLAALFTSLPDRGVQREEVPPQPSFLLTLLGFASIMFSLSAMLTDSSTIITWTWDGFPVKGPTPVPHGAISLAVMCLGIYIGTLQNSRKTLYAITLHGIVGAVLLYTFRGWVGYVGGMMYTVWLCTMVPVCFEQISRLHKKAAAAFVLSFAVTFVITLMHVWVVAYAFVPGGPLMRERTDIVLGLSVVLLLGLIFNYTAPEINTKRLRPALKKIGNIGLLFSILSGIIAIQRLPVDKPTPYHPDSRILTTGIWTIHFGLDNDMWASQTRMRDALRDLEVDVFGLLESDTERIIMGNRDLTERLAEDLNMYADYGPGPNQHTWGCALLSKFPILNSTHYLMPSPVGELACAIHATLDCYGEPIDVVVFHSGQEEDVEDRHQQSQKLAEIMGSTDRPTILLSYLVTTPLEGNYNTYVSDKSGMHDIDPSDDDRWCEYVLYKKLHRIGYARVSRGTITDTEIQSGKFVIPKHGAPLDEAYSQKRIDESEVSPDMRYPEILRGEGVRGHHYHVFDEPRYFE
ncbi:DEKNAAC102583 [Brettanomyces naardenensis]|uniref:DEKNAAC102583 n=1 Tax=Brettanomyces naardenensis TaxID=13370 RepID=A0A448YK61_BRENA|nr:DEKNAAC102583 [Brettanomyces naardenensis]